MQGREFNEEKEPKKGGMRSDSATGSTKEERRIALSKRTAILIDPNWPP